MGPSPDRHPVPRPTSITTRQQRLLALRSTSFRPSDPHDSLDRRGVGQSRRLYGAHNSGIAGGDGHAVGATIGTVALQERAASGSGNQSSRADARPRTCGSGRLRWLPQFAGPPVSGKQLKDRACARRAATEGRHSRPRLSLRLAMRSSRRRRHRRRRNSSKATTRTQAPPPARGPRQSISGSLRLRLAPRFGRGARVARHPPRGCLVSRIRGKGSRLGRLLTVATNQLDGLERLCCRLGSGRVGVLVGSPRARVLR